MKPKLKLILFLLLFMVSFFFLNFFSKNNLQYMSRANYQKANIVVDAKSYEAPLQHNWKAIAQGGEEGGGVRMLENVADKASVLEPRYIRIDHIYDFYSVVTRDTMGTLVFDWSKLDATVCDIYRMRARPFFVLSYMPPAISSDNGLIAVPKKWSEWTEVVQKTIERYSGLNTTLCGGVSGDWFKDIYYEVWNEPDLENFGKWSIYGGEKDYRALYYHTAQGAKQAQNVNRFLIGGPATTRPYRNWFLGIINYVKAQGLPFNFISWHHYSTDINDFETEVKNVEQWLSPPNYAAYKALPRIISEWGYDSNPNPIADTNVGAAHTVATIRYLVEQNIELAFAFELKDGPNPTWGIFTYDGQPKPRFYALKLLNNLGRYRIKVEGEGTYVKTIASLTSPNKVSLVIVNYDKNNAHLEAVPVTINNLENGRYQITETNLKGESATQMFQVTTNSLSKQLIMNPNDVVALKVELQKP